MAQVNPCAAPRHLRRLRARAQSQQNNGFVSFVTALDTPFRHHLTRSVRTCQAFFRPGFALRRRPLL